MTTTASTVRDCRDYISANGLPRFQLYMDCLRSVVQMLEEEELLEAERLERHILKCVPYSVDGTSTGSSLRELAEFFLDIQRRCPPDTLFHDLLAIATRPIDYAEADRHFARVAKEMSAVLASLATLEQLSAGIPQKMVHALRPVRVLRPPSEAARLAAAERLLKWIGHAIAPVRWPWVKPALDQLARQHHQDPGAELRARLLSALFEAVEVAGSYTLADEDEVRRALRAKLGALVTADLLGPDWRVSGNAKFPTCGK